MKRYISSKFLKMAARCAALSLAFSIMFVFPSVSYAFTLTDENSIPITETIPTTTNLVPLMRQEGKNIFLFWDINAQTYFLVGVKDFSTSTSVSAGYPPQFIATTDLTNLYLWRDGDINKGSNVLTDMKCYKYHVGSDTDWVQFNYTNYDQSSYVWSKYLSTPSSYYLYAVDMRVPQSGTQGTEVITYTTDDTAAHTYTEVADFQYMFNQEGEFSGNTVEPEPEPEPEYNGLLGTIINWLHDIWDSISNLPTSISNFISSATSILETAIRSIQGWLTSLGTTIGDFFSDLWDDLSAALTNLGTSIGDFFSDLWDDLSAAFTNIGNWFAEIPNNLRSLFIPSDTFFTGLYTRFDTLLSDRFGAVYDVVTFSEDMIEYVGDIMTSERTYDFKLSFPRLYATVQLPNGNGGTTNSTINYFTPKQIINFSDVFSRWENINYQRIDRNGSKSFQFWTVWDGFINAVCFLGLFHFLKAKYFLIMGVLSKDGVL